MFNISVSNIIDLTVILHNLVLNNICVLQWACVSWWEPHQDPAGLSGTQWDEGRILRYTNVTPRKGVRSGDKDWGVITA